MLYKSTSNFPEKISAMGFGCWSVASYNWSGGETDVAVKAIEISIEEGVDFFDVAPVYGYGDSEILLGKALKGHRNHVLVATKCGLLWNEKDGPTRNCLTKESIIHEVDCSLKRLDMDYVDLLQMHWPDPAAPLEESMDAMADLIRQGKIRYVGLSNFSLEDLKKANSIIPIASYQGLYNLFDRNSGSYCDIPLVYKAEEEILPFCRDNGIAFIPYSPACQGLLTGRYYRDRDKDLNPSDMRLTNPELVGESLNAKMDKVEKLGVLAEKTGYSMAGLSLGWLVSKPEVTTVIVGSRTPEYAVENARIGAGALPDEIIKEIEKIFD